MGSKKWVRKLLLATMALAMIIPMLAACTKNDEVKPGQERVLRVGVLYGGYDDSYFRSQYTDVFEFSKQGAISIEIVPAVDQTEMRWGSNGEYKQPDYVEALKKIMTGANPVDVVVLDASQYRVLARDGLLKQLDPLIQQDKIDTNEFVPTVIDGLKAMGDNNLYGLAPTFNSQALFYNKTIFKEAGVEPPTDNMTWEQVFDKAKLVTTGEGKDRIYGFSFNHYFGSEPFWDMDNYVKPLNLRKLDDNADNMTVNTPKWENVWTTFSKLVAQKIIPGNDMEMPEMQDGQYNPFQYDSFLSGRVAMVLGDYSFINSDLSDAMKNADKIKGFTKFDWDVVTLPSHAEAPGVSGLVSLSSIFSINQKASNPDDAWDFIKFVSSDEWAKLRSRSSYELVSRQKYLKPKDGTDFNIAAFYTMKPVPPTEYDEDELLMKYNNIYEVIEIGHNLFQEVLDNKKSVSDALKEWESKGNQLLKKKQANPVYNK